MPTFVANRISGNNNLLFPDRVDIDYRRVMYYKGSIIGYQLTTIPRTQISSVRVLFNILFVDVIIESSGGRRMEINGLSKSDAREIYALLNQ